MDLCPPELKGPMQRIARTLSQAMPKSFGFALVLIDERREPVTLAVISRFKSKRSGVLVALDELIARIKQEQS